MYQAIETKYVGPTNVKNARVIAKAAAGRVIVSWDHSLNERQNHCAAANKLAKQLDWKGVWSGGGTGKGYTFVQSSPDDFII